MSDTQVTFHETFVSEHRSTERLLSAFKELASAGRWSLVGLAGCGGKYG